MLGKIDHIGIAVKSLQKVLPFYENILHLKLVGVEEVPSQGVKVAFLEIGESMIELLEPTSEESTIASFIRKNGEGVHHVALGCKGIQERMDELKTNGILLLGDTPRQGAHDAQIAFLHPKSTGGVLYELCERKNEGSVSE